MKTVGLRVRAECGLIN